MPKLQERSHQFIIQAINMSKYLDTAHMTVHYVQLNGLSRMIKKSFSLEKIWKIEALIV